MHNIWLIAKREYLERIRTKAFLISTLLIPAIMGGSMLIAVFKSSPKAASHIAIVSVDQQLATDLQAELEGGVSGMKVDVISPPGIESRKTLDSMMADHQLDGYLWITPATDAGTRPSFSYTGQQAIGSLVTTGTIQSALKNVILRERLTHQGMVAADVNALLEPIKVDVAATDKKDVMSNFVATYILFLLMMMSIVVYGVNVARSVIEEKTSRIFEVLLATIRPEEMMAGKVIGVGSVGLTQVGIWMLAGLALTSGSLAGTLAGGAHITLSLSQIIFFVLYFLLGYLLYSALAAALGAMVNTEQEFQQLSMLITLPLVVCSFMIMPLMSNPDGMTARVLSQIPFFSPMLMYLRISVSKPAAWEIALSVALLLVTIYAMLWIASRIYRVGILVYGKRPNLPEILRWLKYS